MTVLSCLTCFSALGQQLLEYRNFEESARRYIQAAGQGNSLAQLGQKCLTGQGITQDYDEFARQVSIAAEQGDQWAQLMLGLAYFAGRGVQANLVSAHMWSNLAGAGSDEKIAAMAREQTSAISQNLSIGQLAKAQELARKWKPQSSRGPEENARVEKKAGSRLAFWRR